MAQRKTKPASSPDQSLRKELVFLLEGGNAHAKFDDVAANFPPTLRDQRPADLPYSAWGLLEHMRIAQADMLEFSRDPNYESRKWPGDYWPRTDAPPSDAAWEKSIKDFRSDLREMVKLVSDPKSDLYTPFPWGEGQNLLREALQVADHNAYHLGQLLAVLRLLGAWKE
jgi:hypothetical protein